MKRQPEIMVLSENLHRKINALAEEIMISSEKNEVLAEKKFCRKKMYRWGKKNNNKKQQLRNVKTYRIMFSRLHLDA